MKSIKSCCLLAFLLSAVMLFTSCTAESVTTDGVTDETTDLNAETVPETDAETVPESDIEDTVAPKDPVRISFVAMGDNLIHSPIFKQAALGGGKYDFLPKYAGVADMIGSADIAFINQETPMCGEEYGYSNYPQFNTPQQMGHDLVTLGFDVICFANNHICDKSSTGLEDMLDFTETLDALTIGAYKNEEEAQKVRVYEHEGVKISFLAYTYDTNISPSSSSDAVVPHIGYKDRDTGNYVIDREKITSDVEKAKAAGDLVIVSMHWGAENKSKVNSMQTECAQLLADLGVDVILGHHPHVVQPIEWIEGKEGNKTLCYYSLGNGISCQDYLMNMVGITASFDIVCEEGKRPYIENASCIPTFCYQAKSYKKVKLILLEDLTEDMAKTHHSNWKGDNVTVENAYALITDTVSAEFLPDYLK